MSYLKVSVLNRDLTSPPRDQTQVPCMARHVLNHWAPGEVPVSSFVMWWEMFHFLHWHPWFRTIYCKGRPSSAYLPLYLCQYPPHTCASIPGLSCPSWLSDWTATAADAQYCVSFCFFPIIEESAPVIPASELWCWRRLLGVPCTARRSNQSVLKEFNTEYSLKGLMLKLKL